MSSKPTGFRQIAAPLDVDDAALERVNQQLGVPTLTKPTTETPAQQPVTERAAVEKLTIELPRYLADALRREAVARRTTARHLVMLALSKDGFEVEDADLVPDGRRARGKTRAAIVL